MDKVYLDILTYFILKTYGLNLLSIAPAKRGFFGETWSAVTQDSKFFVKIDYWDYHKAIYKKNFSIIDYITRNGIDYIPKIIKTKSGDLFCDFNGGIMGIFEFVEGEDTEDYPIDKLFEKLAPIYNLPTDNLSLEKETFDSDVVVKYKELYSKLVLQASKISKQVALLLADKTKLLEHYAMRLQIFSDRCKTNFDGFHITHGDAGGNCIIDGEKLTIVDWDYPKLSPIERDAWFFIWDKKQTDTINTVLKNHGIDYQLNSNRFCYYCYYSFFYYLTEYLNSYFYAKSDDEKQALVVRLN
ncbi:MAG: hypothetical protein HPY74_06530 [Firmicutes bacterium]|nr:hypothetical protein [Bacillota bacterium]